MRICTCRPCHCIHPCPCSCGMGYDPDAWAVTPYPLAPVRRTISVTSDGTVIADRQPAIDPDAMRPESV